MVHRRVERPWVISSRLCFSSLYALIYREASTGRRTPNSWLDLRYMTVADSAGRPAVSKIWRFSSFNLHPKDNKIISSTISTAHLTANIAWLKLITRVGTDRGITSCSLSANYEHTIIMPDTFYHSWNMEFYRSWFGALIGEDQLTIITKYGRFSKYMVLLLIWNPLSRDEFIAGLPSCRKWCCRARCGESKIQTFSTRKDKARQN